MLANLTLLPLETGAACLDGSPYGYYFVPSAGNNASAPWTISFMGGGECAPPVHPRVAQLPPRADLLHRRALREARQLIVSGL